MHLLTTLAQARDLAFGTPTSGGFFGGIVAVNGAPFATILAPKAHGEIDEIDWHPDEVDVPDAMSFSDSMANTLAMLAAGSPLAKWARELDINGFSDWCVPARDALELAYRHLKPSTWTTGNSWRDGENSSSLPPGLPYACCPEIVQTAVEAFQAGNDEAFEDAWYFTSTQYRPRSAWCQFFYNGVQGLSVKSAQLRGRAVRTIQLAL